jgi:feruloyl esterase
MSFATSSIRLSLMLGVAGLALAATAHGAKADEAGCAALAQAGQFANAAVASARTVPANTAAKTPAYCEVTATLSPVPGSKIGVVYRLPEGWNGKLIGYGGGGWAGNVRVETATGELARGYATLQTDGGHPSANAGDATWVAPGGKVDEIALNDYAWRAVHTMTETGKQVALKYYGRAQQKAYFQGCSSGGRMALMEAQRFPNDYDAIVSGAPVYSLRVQLAEIYRDWVFAQPGAAVTPGQIDMVHKAVLDACDAQDGVKDGIVTDPRACKFDPGALSCKAGRTGEQCLTPAQVTAFRREYDDVPGQGGVGMFGFSRGSEPGWLTSLNITADPSKAAKVRDLDLRAAMFGDPNFDFARFDSARDVVRARSGAMAKYYEADNADIRPFLARGGRLILWHGLDDQLPSPWGTVAYYQRVQTTVGAKSSRDGVRLFLAPGVLHCGGGPGASVFDMVKPLDTWVEHGTAPERIAAVRAPPRGPQSATPPTPMSRPICAWPAYPRYKGEGDANDEKSFVCS